jgi:hypothetical protein
MNVVAKRSGGLANSTPGDFKLCLRRNGPRVNLSIEHRAAPGADHLQLTLRTNPLALELMVQQLAELQPTPTSDRQRIEQIPAKAKAPLSQRDAACLRSSPIGGSTPLLPTGSLIPDGYPINPLNLDVTLAGCHATGLRISSVSGLSRKLLHALNRIGQFEIATIWGISARSVM